MNNWANPSAASTQEIAKMALSLEERAQSPDQKQINLEMLQVLAPTTGEFLLEVGCGTGALTRLIAKRIGSGGRITGVDLSIEFAKFAQSYNPHTNYSGNILLGVAKAEVLPFSPALFDKALAARLLLHVSNPRLVLSEMKRVVHPGGKVVVMDWDFETVAVDHSDRELTRRLLHFRCDHHGGNNWRGRQLWRLMKETGFTHMELVPITSIACREEDSLTQSLFRAAEVAQEAGVITSTEYTRWVGEIRSNLAEEKFFASIDYFIIIGKR
ncbi:MAG: methyltransferase domain-containing protein [Anaerolineales bacterium]|jgi:ubiquinone/menaquinone biosynthesis C-methylase UbiE